MLLGPGLCIPPRPQFCCGPIPGTSAGPRVVNKNLFVRSQPRCMAGSLSWCCEAVAEACIPGIKRDYERRERQLDERERQLDARDTKLDKRQAAIQEEEEDPGKIEN